MVIEKLKKIIIDSANIKSNKSAEEFFGNVLFLASKLEHNSGMIYSVLEAYAIISNESNIKKVKFNTEYLKNSGIEGEEGHDFIRDIFKIYDVSVEFIQEEK